MSSAEGKVEHYLDRFNASAGPSVRCNTVKSVAEGELLWTCLRT
jgi:hypothetical protein